jgi:dihydroorotase
MVSGCIMIFGGLLYAFYAKPIIIRRMKQRALEAAAARARPQPAAELVES